MFKKNEIIIINFIVNSLKLNIYYNMEIVIFKIKFECEL